MELDRSKPKTIREIIEHKGDILTRMEALARDDTDIEIAHIEADKILCELLLMLGWKDVVEAWERVPKWYA